LEPREKFRSTGQVIAPDICFPAAGVKLIDDLGLDHRESQWRGNAVPAPEFREQFPAPARVLLSLVGPQSYATRNRCSKTAHRRAGWKPFGPGKRHLGQQVLELVILGPETSDDAVSLFRRRLPELVRPE